MKFGRAINYDVLITPSANRGFIVKCGCGHFAFSAKDELLHALKEYLEDPEATEAAYNTTFRGEPTVVGGTQSGALGTPRTTRRWDRVDADETKQPESDQSPNN